MFIPGKSLLPVLALAFVTTTASAQTQTPAPNYGLPAPGWGQPQPGYGQPAPGYGQPPYGQPGYAPAPVQRRSKIRSEIEIGTLYATAVVYAVGMGSWIGIEADITDPGLFLIPPLVLGLAAPVGVFYLDEPAMHRGMPGALAAGLIIGAGEGVGIAAYQIASAPDDGWGFKGLARATAIGATVGGIGGFLAGYYLEPSPRSTLLATSGMLWGTVVGAMLGYGSSPSSEDWSGSNDWASLGGLIGFNVGLGATAALSAAWVPSWDQIGWMWGGAGIGAAISLPVFLFYVGGDGPPVKRGFAFMGTAVLVGTVAGAIFAPGSGPIQLSERNQADPPAMVTLTYAGPMLTPGGGLGVQVGGVLF